MATAGLGWRQDPEASSRSPVWVPGAILCCFFQAIGRDLDQRWNSWVEPVRTWDASIAGRDFACYTMMPGLEIFSVYTIKEKFPFNLSKSIFLKFLIYKNSNWLSYTCQISNCKDSSSNPPCSLNDLKWPHVFISWHTAGESWYDPLGSCWAPHIEAEEVMLFNMAILLMVLT